MNQEHERPIEWLRQLREEPRQYGALLESAGGMAIAAYRLARARCLVQAVWTSVPTVREVMAAAREIAAHTGAKLYTASLIADCEQAGMVVIQPMKETVQCATFESASSRFRNSRPMLARGSSESTSTSSRTSPRVA